MQGITLFFALLLLSMSHTLAIKRPSSFCLFENSWLFWLTKFRNDAWLDSYDTLRVVTSDFNYLPGYLATYNKSYGEVTGTATMKMLYKSGCNSNAMSTSGTFSLQNPPTDDAPLVFKSHLHEGTCDEIDLNGMITNGIGNHYQDPSVCPKYSYQAYDNTEGCLNSDAPGGKSYDMPLFELWPTFHESETGVYKVGSLGEQGDDLIDCPTPCTLFSCTDCQARSVPWWPLPGTPISIVVHDTPSVDSGSGPTMLCAELTGLAVERNACEAAGISGCQASVEKSTKYCSYYEGPEIFAGEYPSCFPSPRLLNRHN